VSLPAIGLSLVGRTDSLGGLDQWGSHITFLVEGLNAPLLLILEEPEAERLSEQLRDALYDEQEGEK
jgi:hypothetical protein